MKFLKNYSLIFVLTTLITPMNFACLYSEGFIRPAAITTITAVAALWVKKSKALEQLGKELSKELPIDNAMPKDVIIFGAIATGCEFLSRENISWLDGKGYLIFLVYLANQIKNISYCKNFLKSSRITHITECGKRGCNKSCSFCQTCDSLLTLASAYLAQQGIKWGLGN